MFAEAGAAFSICMSPRRRLIDHTGVSALFCAMQEQTDAQTDDQRAACLQFAVLVPVRSALKGRFPLNGTYFQVNEVFLAKPSLCSPIEVGKRHQHRHCLWFAIDELYLIDDLVKLSPQ